MHENDERPLAALGDVNPDAVYRDAVVLDIDLLSSRRNEKAQPSCALFGSTLSPAQSLPDAAPWNCATPSALSALVSSR